MFECISRMCEHTRTHSRIHNIHTQMNHTYIIFTHRWITHESYHVCVNTHVYIHTYIIFTHRWITHESYHVCVNTHVYIHTYIIFTHRWFTHESYHVCVNTHVYIHTQMIHTWIISCMCKHTRTHSHIHNIHTQMIHAYKIHKYMCIFRIALRDSWSREGILLIHV